MNDLSLTGMTPAQRKEREAWLVATLAQRMYNDVHAGTGDVVAASVEQGVITVVEGKMLSIEIAQLAKEKLMEAISNRASALDSA